MLIFHTVQRAHPRFDHRFCFEHFGCSNEALVRRVKALGANVSVNPFYAHLRAELNEVSQPARQSLLHTILGLPTIALFHSLSPFLSLFLSLSLKKEELTAATNLFRRVLSLSLSLTLCMCVPVCVPVCVCVCARAVQKHMGRDRAHSVSRLRLLLDKGVTVASHTDTPVAPPKPLEEIWVACSRRMAGREGQVAAPAGKMPLLSLSLSLCVCV